MPDIVGRLRTPRLAAAPVSPVVGEMYYDTSTNILYWWNGTTWISATGGGGGAAIDYNGDFPANSPYTDGDIVISNGVAYMCVNPTNTAPTAWPGGPTPSPTATPAYGTSLPASPISGQEAILVDSLTNPTYQWRFRYNAGSSSAYKWEFIGGNPQTVFDPTDIAIPAGWNGAYNPKITVPRAGEYLFGYSHYFMSNGGNAGTCVTAIGTTVQWDDSCVGDSVLAGCYGGCTSLNTPLTLAASAVVGVWAYTATAGTINSLGRGIFAVPKRVS